MYFGVMPSLCSTDTEILWVNHFWLSWECSGCLKEKAFNYPSRRFGSSLRFRFWLRGYEISRLIQFIIAVHSQVKSVELTGKSKILNEAPWGLKYLLLNVHEISLSSKFYPLLFPTVRNSSNASLTLNAIWTVLMYSEQA